MTDTRSPIARMIDEACGITPADLEKLRSQWVTMRCPTCEKEVRAPKDGTDPEGTAVVQVDCPDCDQPGNKDEGVRYFASNGQELYFE